MYSCYTITITITVHVTLLPHYYPEHRKTQNHNPEFPFFLLLPLCFCFHFHFHFHFPAFATIFSTGAENCRSSGIGETVKQPKWKKIWQN